MTLYSAVPSKPDSSPRQQIVSALLDARSALDALLASESGIDSIEKAATLLIHVFERQGRVYACGNGGSMSDAMHFAEELTGRYRDNRPGLAAQAISDVGHLSCVANDFGYDQVFSRYVATHGRSGDCLFAISTSGRSANVINAAVTARERGMTVIALTGNAESTIGTLADVCIATPAGPFADRIQELHIKAIHILIEMVERHFYPQNYDQAPSGAQESP